MLVNHGLASGDQLPPQALRVRFIMLSEMHLGLAALSRGQSYG